MKKKIYLMLNLFFNISIPSDHNFPLKELKLGQLHSYKLLSGNFMDLNRGSSGSSRSQNQSAWETALRGRWTEGEVLDGAIWRAAKGLKIGSPAPSSFLCLTHRSGSTFSDNSELQHFNRNSYPSYLQRP
jgi:hypothetical protein